MAGTGNKIAFHASSIMLILYGIEHGSASLVNPVWLVGHQPLPLGSYDIPKYDLNNWFMWLLSCAHACAKISKFVCTSIIVVVKVWCLPCPDFWGEEIGRAHV